MAIDFTGVTNVFMGGNTVYSADTSLQAVCQGETEQWAYSNQGYVWRMMGGTINGYDRFGVGDVVCFGSGGSSWTGMTKTNRYDCSVPNNYITTGSNYNNKIGILGYGRILSWSDAVGSDGVTIGWHLPDKIDTLKMAKHSYVVKQTASNGVYAKFTQGYGTLGTATINNESRMYMYPLLNTSEQWWCTDCSYSNQAGWYSCKIKNDQSIYIYGGDGNGVWKWQNGSSGLLSKYNVIFKRVKIAQ